jgi:endonuclease/exonuclease/phosphatase (EEP) superfamily protein YafD
MKKPREICAAIGALVRAPALCIAVFSAFAFVGFVCWPVELFSHFRVQYAVLLAMAIPYLLYLERNKLNKIYLATCIVALIANLAVVTLSSTSFGSATSNQAQTGATPLSLLQFNVNSSNTNYPKFDKLIERTKPDIVCVEEVSEGWREHFEKLKSIYPYQSVRARTDNFGIGILSKYKIVQESREPIGIAGVPTIFIEVTVPSEAGEKQIQVIATHPPPPVGSSYTNMRDVQMHEIAKRIAQSQKLTILAGDFNCTPWCYIFTDFVRESGLLDSRLNKGIQPTWPTMLPYMVIPIDHVFMSPTIKCTERTVQEDCGSDHFPVLCKFTL